MRSPDESQLTDVRLTPERKERLRALVELDRGMTVDELMYMAGAYESLATRVATEIRSADRRRSS